MRREIEEKLQARGMCSWELEEIRLSRFALSSIRYRGEEIPLAIRMDAEVIPSMVRAICHGAPFAHREEMAQGYLPFDGGVRVGVVGICHNESDEKLPAIREIHTLIFRIPHQPSMEREVKKLSFAVQGSSRRGCLIVSPPRVGKTTVLRMLCRALSTGERALRVAMIDTRFEFTEEDSKGAFLDILSGYPRQIGARIALRTLAPEVLSMDEIGTEEDVEALCDVMRAGVLILASAHANGLEDIYNRPYLSRILHAGVFDTVLTLHRQEGSITWKLFRL